MSKKPVILIGCDGRSGDEKRPRDGVYSAYVDGVINAGGLPLIMPARAELLDDFLALADGVLLPGGDDINPSHFGEADQGSEPPFLDERRVALELAILRRMFHEDRPLLGICAGSQTMNVALGGTLIQHLGEKTPTHRQPGERYSARHPVHIEGGSELYRILGKSETETNSSHHQAIGRVADSLRVTARSPDGEVEAVEAPAKRFFIGVQWHPETDANADSQKLFRALIDSCR